MRTRLLRSYMLGPKAREMEVIMPELMKEDRVEEARKARRDWLRRLDIPSGVWVKRQVRPKTEQ